MITVQQGNISYSVSRSRHHCTEHLIRFIILFSFMFSITTAIARYRYQKTHPNFGCVYDSQDTRSYYIELSFLSDSRLERISGLGPGDVQDTKDVFVIPFGVFIIRIFKILSATLVETIVINVRI